MKNAIFTGTKEQANLLSSDVTIMHDGCLVSISLGSHTGEFLHTLFQDTSNELPRLDNGTLIAYIDHNTHHVSTNREQYDAHLRAEMEYFTDLDNQYPELDFEEQKAKAMLEGNTAPSKTMCSLLIESSEIETLLYLKSNNLVKFS